MNEIAVTPFNTDQINLIRRTIAVGATDDELRLFLYQAGRVGLDPLSRQIFAVKRWNSSLRKEVMTIQTSIDGFRLIADRSGKYAGQVGPMWCGADGLWKDVWVSDKPPLAARVGALRSDFREPCWGVARFDTYAQKTKEGKLTRAWETMPDLMCAKCAEALALRKAFPTELSGIYTGDEMAQVSSEKHEQTDELSPPPLDQHDVIEPHAIPLAQSHGSMDWRAFGTTLAERLRHCDSKHNVFRWLEINDALLKRMASAVPQMHGKLQETIEAIKNEPT